MVGKLEDFTSPAPSEDVLETWQRDLVGKNVRLFIPLDNASDTGRALREMQRMMNDLVEVDHRHRHDPATGHPKTMASEFYYLREVRDVIMRYRTLIEPGRKKQRGIVYGENVTRLRK